MKITEAWDNRQEIINKCRDNDACDKEFTKLKQANNQVDFDNVLLKNFSWCVSLNVLECWLPDILPVCKYLDCSHTEIKELPKLPVVEILCCFSTKITKLPELLVCTGLYCDDTKITKLPELPVCEYINCRNTQITKLPKLPMCIILDCDYSKIRKETK